MLKEGLTATQKMTVSDRDTAQYHGSGKLNVYATPSMIAFMENTAMAVIDNDLDTGTDTVGIHIDVKHIKATKQGGEVTCTATLVKVDGKKLSFEIEASDQDGVIGKANHTRYIIVPDVFMDRI